ncbi:MULTISPECIES: NADH-quinone oxidoreductase subunit NuoN [Actinomadura]|uniref:NADH-quinone oxidoreductase subunit N n=1 Tax=Actinomadura litoris TaxID=2678616 RepID=A0A7K1LDG9_9ACTN|nr:MULTISPECIES: NADH-quinone oxidoreductase subunit NuoN [Actinomadura]MBT2210271.1 NADH-quinone oxidoreductase subunit NuoN [Actinomadura sp. NEAU-AAG7]MUN42464.1 NADH-quinone oxidoreductase subunit NuoN [Actinomadura litoris]
MSRSSQVSAVLAQGGDIPAPHIEYDQIGPLLLVLGIAVAGVLVEAFVGRTWRYYAQVPLAFLGLAGAFAWTIVLGVHDEPHHVAAEGALGVDGPTLFLQGTILVLALVSLLLIAERGGSVVGGGHFAAQASALPGSEAEQRSAAAGITQTEVFPLMMFAVGGMLMFPASNDLLTMFVALEVMSLPLYLLCGLARRRRLLSQEAAVKYFLLGAFSSAFFLYGAALLYGYAGSVRLADISAEISKDAGSETLLLAGVALLSVGLLFKLGAVPFHMWKPDVYQGAPTPITALMASCTLVAAFGAILRVYYVGFETLKWDWEPIMWGVAILTMVIGAVIAITQTDLKRMLAYSSIAHAGFLLTAVVATSRDGLSSALFYLAAYGFTTVGAFAVITMVRDAGGEAAHLSRWAGLGKRSPVVAGTFAFFLLAFAGIPLTSGFTGKFAVFKAAVQADATPLVIVGVISSAIAAFFYVRVIVVMFFSEPEADGPTVVAGPATAAAVALGLTATVVLGVLPQPILDLAGHATTHMFVR